MRWLSRLLQKLFPEEVYERTEEGVLIGFNRRAGRVRVVLEDPETGEILKQRLRQLKDYKVVGGRLVRVE